MAKVRSANTGEIAEGSAMPDMRRSGAAGDVRMSDPLRTVLRAGVQVVPYCPGREIPRTFLYCATA